ncbi:MAG: AMP-binding protein, partial [Acidobacteriota bacterium]|nr:AMP-binding protein [Acidobacteriota bacterium]
MSFRPPERFNIADYFLDDRVREGRGDRVALVVGDETRTYAEVEAAANRFANVLAGLDVRPEERVMIALPDGPEWVAACFGTLKLGAVVVMVNPHLKPDGLTALFEYVRPRLVVVGDGVREAFEDAAARAERRPDLLVVGEDAGSRPRYENLAAAVPDRFRNVPTHRDDPAIWLFSGGTTGLPKGVVQSHASFANTTELYAKAALGYGADDRTLAVPKLYFGYATGSNLLFPFAVGASAVLFPEHPTAELLFELIERHRPTILVNVPTMVSQMVGHPAAAQRDLSSLRFATSAGEALPVSLYHRWKELFGVELLDGLGTAEMWHIFVT